MDFGSTFFYKYRRFCQNAPDLPAPVRSGLIVMLADNDAGGITTYTVTGAKFGYGLIWFLLLLLPVAYVVQEMTVRLGAVTKRGHAEAIFDAFGSFWGWFSFLDLALVNWLTLITEFIGMTAALMIFHIPPLITVAVVSIIMMLMVLQGRYWTWEKIALLFAALNLIYIPAAFMVHPSVGEVLSTGLIPHFPGGLNGTLFFFLMANIGTTIAPWMIFFQQSAVVDKGMKEKDIPGGRWTPLSVLHLRPLSPSSLSSLPGPFSMARKSRVRHRRRAFLSPRTRGSGRLLPLVSSTRVPWRDLHIACNLVGVRGGFRVGTFAQPEDPRSPLVLRVLLLCARQCGSSRPDPQRPPRPDHALCAGCRSHPPPCGARLLILLLNNEEIMGNNRNTRLQNIAAITIVVMIIVLSTLYGITTLFPGLIYR